jgi:ABC-type glycerol-3-phosphate transport system substrate-binding protein
MTTDLPRRSVLLGGLTAAAALMSACSGVSGGSSGAGAGGGTSGPGGRLALLLVDQASTKELQSTILPSFSSSTGIGVDVELVPESGLEAKLTTGVTSSRSQYDVLMTGVNQWAALIGRGAITPLDAQMASVAGTPYLQGFPATLLSNLAVSGKHYAMPYQVGAELLYVNLDLWAKAGLDPAKLPTTVDEVVAAADTITAKTGVPGFVGRGTRNANENSFLWLMLWFLAGGRWPAGSNPADFTVLTAPEAITATTQYLHLLTKDAPPGAVNMGFAEAQVAMQQGKAGMWLDAAQLGPSLEKASTSTIAGKVGYAALTSNAGRSDYIVGAVWGFSIAEASAAKDDAWKLVQFLTSKDTGLTQLKSGTNGSSGRSDILGDPSAAGAVQPGFGKALTEAIAHTNPLYTPTIAQGSKIRGALALELSTSLSSGRDAQATMQAAQAAVQALLK